MLRVKAHDKFATWDVHCDGFQVSEAVQKYVLSLLSKETKYFFGEPATTRITKVIEQRVNSKLQNDLDCGRIRLINNTWIEVETLWVDL